MIIGYFQKRKFQSDLNHHLLKGGFMKNLVYLFLVLHIFGVEKLLYSQTKDLITSFDLSNYNQNIDNYISPQSPDYDIPLIDPEEQSIREEEFYKYSFGSKSAWDKEYVQSVLDKNIPNDIKSLEQYFLTRFSNKDKPETKLGYGSNYRVYPLEWIENCANNMNIDQFQIGSLCNTKNMAIAVHNLHCRNLPTDDVHLYNHKLPGEGYPFDYLQNSAIWVGTPLYILGISNDKQWALILTPFCIGWVKSNGIARVNSKFIDHWRRACEKRMLAIVKTKSTILSFDNNTLLTSYIGTVLPEIPYNYGLIGSSYNKVLFPVRNTNGNASIRFAKISKDAAKEIPLPATPRNISMLIKELIGRQYGWGHMYFYNDCSGEMKSLFTPLGIWMAKYSAAQVDAGVNDNISDYSESERINYIVENAQPLTTIIYIGGHVYLYVGNTTIDGKEYPLSYQNIWGLAPVDRSRRSVLGGSVLLPILDSYPEDADLVSLAAKKYCILVHLDQMPMQKRFTSQVDIRSLMFQDLFERE